jgi:acyl carrier protein
MTDTHIAQRAHKLVLEHLGVDPDRITTDASFTDDLGCDSLDSVELCMAVEEEFGVEMADDESERIFDKGTFGDLLGWLDQQRIVA